MNCRQFLGELCDYLDNPQDAGHSTELEGHLAACRKCRIVCETTRQTVRLYKSCWSVCEVPPDVEARLLAAIAHCKPGRRAIRERLM